MTDNDQAPSDSSWRPTLAGCLIIALFFGGLGSWAYLAPLNGAVVANGVVKVEGNRKSVQHLDGGIVRKLRVKEGDRVEAGEVVIVLDDTQAKAEFEVLSEQYVVLRATEVRLLAELADEAALVVPPELASRASDPYARNIWAGQVKQFESRRAAIEGQRRVIGEKIRNLGTIRYGIVLTVIGMILFNLGLSYGQVGLLGVAGRIPAHARVIAAPASSGHSAIAAARNEPTASLVIVTLKPASSTVAPTSVSSPRGTR